MNHPFSVLQGEYTRLLATMVVTRPQAVDQAAHNLLKTPPFDRHSAAAQATGVPEVLIATLDLREDDCDPHAGLGQGDPWNRVSTHVPRGKGPFKSWAAAAAYYIHYDHLDDNSAPWSMPYACWKAEAWNGFGPRNHGINTGYLWSGTNHYTRGKYVADGVWDSSHADTQLGVVPIMLRMIDLRPELAIGPTITPITSPSVLPLPSPIGVGGNLTGTEWIQDSLNRIMKLNPPLLVDGNYGRLTRRAVRLYQSARGLVEDGLVGDETCISIDADLAKLST